MARGVRWGTPERTEHYLHPRRPHLLLKSRWVHGLVLLALACWRSWAGARR